MAARSPREIRASVENTRQELEYALNDPQSRVSEMTDWKSRLAEHRREVLIGAAVAGFLIGGGIAAIAGVFK